MPQAYFLTLDDAHRITQLTVYCDNVTLGIQGRANAVRLVEAITALGKH